MKANYDWYIDPTKLAYGFGLVVRKGWQVEFDFKVHRLVFLFTVSSK